MTIVILLNNSINHLSTQKYQNCKMNLSFSKNGINYTYLGIL